MKNVKVNSERWLSPEPFEGEEWRPVVGYEKYYLISSCGRLKSLDRYTLDNRGRNLFHRGKIVKVFFSRCGYAIFRLSIEGKLICVSIHRLVAEAFIPNNQNLPFVNHIDEDKSNNCVDNLEWITNKDNINYKSAQKRHSDSLRKVLRDRTYIITQYDLNGNEMNTFRGKREILDAGFSYDGVVHCCNGITKTHKGYVWKRRKPMMLCN